MADLFDLEIPDTDTGSIEGDLRLVYRYALNFVNTEKGLAVIRLAVSEANRDARSAAVYRNLLDRRIVLTRQALDRARARGEPIRSTADPVLMVEWMAGVFVVRALTGQPMPRPEDADRLGDITPREILDVPPSSGPEPRSERHRVHRQFGDPADPAGVQIPGHDPAVHPHQHVALVVPAEYGATAGFAHERVVGRSI